jgi:xanthine dehydrogenase accessory factor
MTAHSTHIDFTADTAPFLWLLREHDQGRGGALLTITGADGGSPRPVGTHMAVVDGARFAGYLSGGCVEPAVAVEVEALLASGGSRRLRFGQGSPFFDIRFPCGGGIDVLVTPNLGIDVIEDVLCRMAQRQDFTLALSPDLDSATVLDGARELGWSGQSFHRPYLPVTRLCLAGRGPELEAVARVAAASGYEVEVATPDSDTAQRVASFASRLRHLHHPSELWDLQDDKWTATVLLFHEREWEEPILKRALAGPGFYIGALGSRRTHAARIERLLLSGSSQSQVERIVGPIGIIPQARDPATLALSLLGEIALRRREADGWTGASFPA